MLNKQELKQEGIKKESSVEAKEVKPVEKTMESTMAESLDSLERRRERKDRSGASVCTREHFACTVVRNSVQILALKHVFDAVNSLVQIEKRRRRYCQTYWM